MVTIRRKVKTFRDWLENKVGSKGKGSISEGFVTATLIFAIGAMGILGALDSGIRGNHDILFTKAIIDGFISIILTTTLGIGVVFSAIPVVLYEGGIAVLQHKLIVLSRKINEPIYSGDDGYGRHYDICYWIELA